MNPRYLGFWIGSLLLTGCGAAPKESIQVFAATSTRAALESIARNFQAETGIPVECNLAGTNTLARQIEQGAGADLFLSADEDWADYLAGKGLVAERRDLLTNRLVVIVPSASPLAIHDLADLTQSGITRLALAGPAVPAGRYARQALTKAKVWDRVKDRVLDGMDVRAALTYVGHGEAEAGLVYATDAAGSSRVRRAFEVKPELHDPIRYPLVLIQREPIKPAARQFYSYIHLESALEVFRRAGFGVVP